jgi:hypothetical protein
MSSAGHDETQIGAHCGVGHGMIGASEAINEALASEPQYQLAWWHTPWL